MSEKCKTCDGTGSVPAEVETAEGPMPCPYIGAPCPDCSPMPERVIMVRESEWREMREMRGELELAANRLLACSIEILPENLPKSDQWAEWSRQARAAIAKSEATATQPVAHAYVVAGECEQIEWGTDVDLPDDPALVWLYAHPAPLAGGDDE